MGEAESGASGGLGYSEVILAVLAVAKNESIKRGKLRMRECQ